VLKEFRTVHTNASYERVLGTQRLSKGRFAFLQFTRAQLSLVCVGVSLTGALLGSGCNQIDPREATKDPDHFELKQDASGRIVRLNKATGEMAFVEGTKLIPISFGGAPSQPSRGSTQGATHPSRATATKRSTPDSAQKTATVQRSPGSDSANRSDMGIIAITDTAPVYAAANRTGPPLVLAARGSRFRVTASQVDWYRIEFDDAQLGHRVGYVEKKFTDASRSRLVASSMQPVDVSIVPSAQTNRLEPVDVSIPRSGGANSQPVDVSITAPPQK
jgi:hypothetical protein